MDTLLSQLTQTVSQAHQLEDLAEAGGAEESAERFAILGEEGESLDGERLGAFSGHAITV